MRISIIHPSRSRPQQAAATAKKWLSSAKRPDLIDYWVSVDNDDPMLQTYLRVFESTTVMLAFNDNSSAIEAINNVAKGTHKAGVNDLIVVVSDDFSCPFHWDEALRKHLSSKSDYLVKTDDGAQPWIITLPIMDRLYYQRFGYVYYPKYKHMFCDTEMTHVGEMLNKTLRIPVTFKHNHYTTGNSPKDLINDKNDRTWGQGEELYLRRVMNNFGLSDDEIDTTYLDRVHSSHIAWLRTKGIDFVKV